MGDGSRYTACCGLYCADCIPSRRRLFDAARTLLDILDEADFARYAALKAENDAAFSDYGRFKDYLSAVIGLECPAPCSEGGGKPVCVIRSCAGEKGYAGCWECAGFESCDLFIPFRRYHGDTPVENLTLIRQHGIENWAYHRGPHYLWSKRPR